MDRLVKAVQLQYKKYTFGCCNQFCFWRLELVMLFMKAVIVTVISGRCIYITIYGGCNQ